jgi:hypothetical protein
MWGLWWTKRHWGEVFPEYFGFPCQSSFQQFLHHHNHPKRRRDKGIFEPVLKYLSTTPWRRVGEWRYSSTIVDFGTKWRWVVSFSHRPLYKRGRSFRYPLDSTYGGWAPEPVWALRNRKKISCVSGNRTPAVQPVAHRYTNWSTRGSPKNTVSSWVWGSQRGSYEEVYILGYNVT